MAKTILLADDSVTIQKVVELTFMDEDYEVESAGSGTEALERLARAPAPDLVIADVHMPGADGYEVCRQAKARHPDLPVLLLVGTFEPFDEARAADVGADANLKKPFDSQDLLRQVADLLSTPKDAAEAVTTTLDRPPAPPDATPEPEAASADEAFLDAMAGDDDEPPESVELTADQRELSDSFISPDPSTAEVPPDDLADVVAEADARAAAEAEKATEQAVDVEATAEIEAQPEIWDADVDIEATAEIEAQPEVDETVETEPVAEPDDAEDAFELAPEPVAAAAVGDGERHGGRDGRDADGADGADGGNGKPLSDQDVDRIARRVAELAGAKVLREVAWEVLPDLAEVVIKERIRELEGQVE